MHPPTVLFDDDRGRFGPLGDLRPSFELRTGALTTRERLVVARGPVGAVWVPPRLEALQRERGDRMVNALPEVEACLCVNGRILLPELVVRLDRPEAIVEPDGTVVAALLPRDSALHFLREGRLEDWVPRREVALGNLCSRPWHVLDALDRTLRHDLAAAPPPDAVRPPEWCTVYGEHPVAVHPSASVMPGVVIDATGGPVHLHEGVVVRPQAVLVGPCSIGPRSVVAEHGVVKARTAVGPDCRVGGEIGGTIMQAFSNKVHDGHLGDALVGEWVNLGAATTNSNLLNTYGEVVVRLDPNGPRERSGRQFMGSVIGDHVKTAIGTRLMTGTVLGTGAMIATTAPPPTTVPSFAWLVDDGAQRFRWPRFEETMRAVMSRRSVEPGPEYVARLRELWGVGVADSS